MSRKADQLVQLEQPSIPLATIKKLLLHGGSLVTDDRLQFKSDVNKAIQQSVGEFTTYMTTLAISHMQQHNENSKTKRKMPSSDDLYHAIDDLDIPFIRQQVALRSVAQSRIRWLALAKKHENNPNKSSSKKSADGEDIEQDDDDDDDEEEGEDEEQVEEEEEEENDEESEAEDDSD
jgi:hypothetical protein